MRTQGGISDPTWAGSNVSNDTESDGSRPVRKPVRGDERTTKRNRNGRRADGDSKKSVRYQLDDQGNDLSKLEQDTNYKKGDILPDAYISNNKISDPLNPAKLPKKEFTVTWEEESTWGRPCN